MSRFLPFAVFFLVLLAVSTSQAAPAVSDLKLNQDGNRTILTLFVNGNVPSRAFVLNNPPRIVIDLPKMAWRAPMNKGDRAGRIKSYRTGIYQGDTLRLVLDLKTPLLVSGTQKLPPVRSGGPFQYVFTLSPADPMAFAGAAHPATSPPLTTTNFLKLPEKRALPTKTPLMLSTPQTPPPAVTEPAAPVLTAPSADKKPLIVIDAGHGGVDPGAIASNGVFEKTITLAMAREVGRQLEATGKYRVHLTRSRDIFIKLPERVAIARRLGADLFVSLHADTVARPQVQGASVYSLSDTASDTETAKLAERENAVDTLVNVDVGKVDADVADILLDLVTRDTMNQGKTLAETVVTSFHHDGIALLPQRPHRAAGFAVLKAPDIPSVLIEMGFLSNRQEVQRLTDDKYRTRLATAVVHTIQRYFNETSKHTY